MVFTLQSGRLSHYVAVAATVGTVSAFGAMISFSYIITRTEPYVYWYTMWWLAFLVHLIFQWSKAPAYFLWTALFFIILYLLIITIVGIHMMATADNDFLQMIYTIYNDGTINPYAPGIATFSSFGAFPQPTLSSRLWKIMFDQSSASAILPTSATPLETQHVPLQRVMSGSSTHSGPQRPTNPSPTPATLANPFVVSNDDSETSSIASISWRITGTSPHRAYPASMSPENGLHPQLLHKQSTSLPLLNEPPNQQAPSSELPATGVHTPELGVTGINVVPLHFVQ